MLPGIVAVVASAELVHPVPSDDVEGWARQVITSLLNYPSSDFAQRVERWKARLVPERTWAFRDRGRIIATLATDARTMTIPAGNGATTDISVDALTGVTVAATHRRNGYMTQMLSASLRAARERGDAVSVLLAAEWPIYGRFGYAPAMQYANYTYYPRRHSALVAPAIAGSVREVEPAELLEHAPAIFERHRRQRGGQINRTQKSWELTVGTPDAPPVGGLQNWYLHEGANGPDGFVTWRVSRDFELDGRLGAIEVDHLVAASDEAYRNLWSYLGGIDVIDEVSLGNRPVDEPIRFMLGNGRALTQTYSGDSIWLCLLDVPAALTARGYAVPGRLVLDLVDDSLGGYAGGRYVLDACPDGVSCTATTQSPDLTMPASVLAACYFGAHKVRVFAAGGEVVEHTAGAVQLLDTMLGTALQPWCQTPF